MKITTKHIMDFFVSMITVVGVYLGTTDFYGSIIYEIAMFGWWIIIYNNKAWGVIPGQIAFTIAGAYNIYITWK